MGSRTEDVQAEASVNPIACSHCGHYHNSVGSLVNCISDGLRAMRLEIERSNHSEAVAIQTAQEALRRGEIQMAAYSEVLAQRCYETFAEDIFGSRPHAVAKSSQGSGPPLSQSHAVAWAQLPEVRKNGWRKVAGVMLVADRMTMETVGE